MLARAKVLFRSYDHEDEPEELQVADLRNEPGGMVSFSPVLADGRQSPLTVTVPAYLIDARASA